MSILVSLLKGVFAQRGEIRSAQVDQKNNDFGNIRQVEGGVVIGFTVGSEGNALAELTKALLAPFAGRAARVVLLDAAAPDLLIRLRDVLSEPVWFAASYFSAGQNVSITNESGQSVNLWEHAGIPFVRFFGDIPAYFPDRHVAYYKNSINAYTDSSHIKFYRRWFDHQALSVLHPRVILELLPLDSVDASKKQTGKMIFPKNGNSPAALRSYWRNALPATIVHALNSVAEECIAKHVIDQAPCFDDRLIQYFSRIGVALETQPSVLCFLVAQLDDYVRRVKSTMIAEALLDFPVIIRGRNWEHIDFHGRRASYDENSDVASTQCLIDQAPALIDMSPNTQESPHDRICRAVGRGTAFLTNKQQFLDVLFADTGKFCFEFSPDSIGSLVEKYVSDLPAALELGIEQSMVLRKSMDESNYLESLLAAIDVVALRCGRRPPGTQNFVSYPPCDFVGKT